MSKTPDVADFLAKGGDPERVLAKAKPMTTLAERRALDLDTARAALKAAIVVLGAEQTRRDERREVAKQLTDAVPALAWLSVLAPSEWSTACLSMQACGSFGESLAALRKAVRDAAVEPARAKRDDERQSRPVSDGPRVLDIVLGDLASTAEIPDGLLVPRPYLVTPTGTFIMRESKTGEQETTRICQRPVFIVGVGIDLEDETQSVIVRWHTEAGWRSRPLSRKTVCVSRLLADESEHGFPVSSENARGLVAYFDAFLGENEDRLPRRMTTRTLGWKKGGFLWGNSLVGKDGLVENASVELSRLDPGVAQAVRGYRSAGTYENWCTAIRRIAHLPRVMLSLYAAMAPPLLSLLQGATANGIIDWAGETSGGKTSTLRVGASVWGYPDDKGDGIIRPWESSGVYIERMAALCNDIPIFLDDTKRVRKREEIGKVLYMVAQGQGRGRGTLQGIAAMSTWRTFLQSTGEAPATSYAQDGGAAARCLTVWGPPFDSAELAESTAAVLLRNYGHLGPKLVAWLQVEGRVAEVRERFKVHAGAAVGLGPGNVVRRMSSTVALLALCAEIASDLGVPTATVDPTGILIESVSNSAREADKAAEALEAVYGWAVSQQTRFYGRHIVDVKWDGQTKTQETRAPLHGWLGAWRLGDWKQIAFDPNHLKTFLTDHGFDYGAVVRTWRDRGLSRTSKPTALTATAVMPGGLRPQFVIITREATAAFDGGVCDADNPEQSHLFEPHGDGIVEGVS
jgi:putative DNA primase/helicase